MSDSQKNLPNEATETTSADSSDTDANAVGELSMNPNEDRAKTSNNAREGEGFVINLKAIRKEQIVEALKQQLRKVGG